MTDFQIVFTAVILGVLVVAGIKAIIMDIKDAITNYKIKKILQNDFELMLKAEDLKEKILTKIAEGE